jgi:thiamine phosphate synthase YjbQ (UPF0047 family)
MRQAATILELRTSGRGLAEITDRVVEWVDGVALETGLLTLFCRHTSASLLIQENAARAARQDLETFFDRSLRRTRPATDTTTRGRTTCLPTSAPRSRPSPWACR